MSELRSSQQQNREEMAALYRNMTDPREIEKREQKEHKERRIKSKKQRYGI